MLFVYWLEETPEFGKQVASIIKAMRERQDVLCASVFSLAEMLVGPRKCGDAELAQEMVDLFRNGSVEVLPFDLRAADRFAQLRAQFRVTPSDAMHLACAASAGVDLFLTNDASLRKLIIPGIKFIDDLHTSVLRRD